MNALRHALAGFLAASCCGAVSAAPLPAHDPAAGHAAFHSFADLVRAAAAMDYVAALDAMEEAEAIPALAESASAGASLAAPNDGPALARVEAIESPAIRIGEERFRFSVQRLPEPQRWLLALSGLVAAGWVARRRLLTKVPG